MNLQCFFYKHDGFARMEDLKENKFHTRVITKAVEENIMKRLSQGCTSL